MPMAIRAGLAEFISGVRLWPVWVALAQEDIDDQHRRTTLGPAWLTINYLLFAGTFIFVIHRSGPEQASFYAPYAAIGLMIWFYLMDNINQAVTLFAREEGYIKGTRLPLSVYVLRLGMQALIRAIYTLIGCMAIVMISGFFPTLSWLWSVLAIALILATIPAVIIILAMLGTFFPDSQFIISNLMRVGMFLTPIFWMYTSGEGGVRGVFYYWNPFTYFINLVRDPVLSGEPHIGDAVTCVAISAVAWVAALHLLGRLRRDVVFAL